MKLKEIADRLSCHLEGDGEVDISGIATLEAAQTGQISFLTNLKYLAQARNTRAVAIIVGLDAPDLNKTLLKHENPYLVFAKVLELFHPAIPTRPYIDPTACIAPTVHLGQRVSIGAHAVIGDDTIIGDDVMIGPNCVIYKGAIIGSGTIIHSGCAIREMVSIGARCIIHNNTVIGSDGFGFAKVEDGRWYKISQIGTVIIEDEVEIGACSTIDRATLGETRIGLGTKIDNLVHIGHGTVIGSNALLCAQVGLAGSTEIGNRVILGGQVGAAGHLTIGEEVIATAQTGIPSSVERGKIISGSPAIDHKQWLKSSAVISRLPEIQKSLRTLERRLSRIEQLIYAKPEATKES
jgi:UDP-3-O-[3-hydroxymyristoyl] glucosamine N-acyltransferase